MAVAVLPIVLTIKIMPHVDQEFKYVPLPKYPHMRPADVEIWERFMRAFPNRFTRVFYDVHLGGDETFDHNLSERANISWWDLTSWCVDVVAENDEAIFIIELKPLANAKAIGQAISYAALFKLKFKPVKPVIPVIITDRIIETTQICANHCGVELWAA